MRNRTQAKPPQIIVVTHRGASSTEIDPYISTLFSPATVLYLYSRWGKDPKNKLPGMFTFYEVIGASMSSDCFVLGARM